MVTELDSSLEGPLSAKGALAGIVYYFEERMRNVNDDGRRTADDRGRTTDDR